MKITFWMAIIIVFMFMLLVYGLVHRNKFIIGSSVIGIIVYFITLPPILTNGGSIKEYQLKKEWPTIQEESNGNYAEYLTLLKKTFAHDAETTAELTYYAFALDFHKELKLAIKDEKAIEHLPTYDTALHNTLIERKSFYKSLMEQHSEMTLPRDPFYENIHTTFKNVLTDLERLNEQNEALQKHLQLATPTDKAGYLAEHMEQFVDSLNSLNQSQKEMIEQIELLSKHLESAISYELNI